jgi:transcriptional regulator with XRE-family HTH domain
MAEVMGARESFGSSLRAFRERAGWSQSALARKAGLDPSFVNRLESGQRGAERSVAEALIGALGLAPAEADRLLAAGGYLPASLAAVGVEDPTLRRVVQFLGDPALGAGERAAFDRLVALGTRDPTLRQVADLLADDGRDPAERAGFRGVVALAAADPLLRQVAAVLTDERLTPAERDDFRQVLTRIAARWRPAGGVP